MSILWDKDATSRMENVRLLTKPDRNYFTLLNRPHEDIEQRTEDLDRFFTPARGLRVRQVLVATTNVEVEVGVYVDTDGITIAQSNGGAVQTIAIPAAAAGQIRADLIYFNLSTGLSVRVAGSEVIAATGFSSALWPDLPTGLEGAIPLGIVYVDDVPTDFDEQLTGNVAGQIIDVRPAIGSNRPLFSTTAPLTDTTGGSAGTGVKISRHDHRHAINVNVTVPEILNLTKAAAVGAAATYSRRDHVHALSAEASAGNILADAAGGAVGILATIARADHQHNLNVDAVVPVTLYPDSPSTVGIKEVYPRRDHRHGLAMETVVGQLEMDTGTGALGTRDYLTRSDHQHPLNCPGAGLPETVDIDAGSLGSSDYYSRFDHKHPFAGLQASIFKLSWSGSAAAQSTGAIGFTPACAIALNIHQVGASNTRPAASIGVLTGTGTDANSICIAEKADGDANYFTVSADDDSAGGHHSTVITSPGIQSSHDLMDLDCTAFGAANITLDPSTTITGVTYLLVLGSAT